jgi:hypothetical protein
LFPYIFKYLFSYANCDDEKVRICAPKKSWQITEIIYFTGNAPFAKHDVTSRSALLGIGVEPTGHYWAHKNPNAVGRKTGNRKKKQV